MYFFLQIGNNIIAQMLNINFGGMFMKKNSSIGCDIKNCQYNCQTEDYCSLDTIKVGTHEANPTVPECTDCKSFVVKKGCC